MHPRRPLCLIFAFCLIFTQTAQAYSLASLPYKYHHTSSKGRASGTDLAADKGDLALNAGGTVALLAGQDTLNQSSSTVTVTNASNVNQPGFQTDTVNFAKMMAGIAVAITGGDANAINLAASTGGNAAENNYLLHDQNVQWKNELAACKNCSKQKIDAINARYAKLDATQDKTAQRCIGEACTPITNALQKDIQDKTQAIVSECGPGPTVCGLQYTTEISHEKDLLNGPSGTWARTDAISSLSTWANEQIIWPYLDMRENNLDLMNRAANGDENARQQFATQLAFAFVGGMRPVGTFGSITEQVAVKEGTTALGIGDGLAFRSDLPSHMIGPDGFTKSGQLSGTHNLDNAINALDTQGTTYSINPTSTTGISELQYTFTNPAGKVVTSNKTVYDPAVFSDQIMLDNAQQAGQQAWMQYLQNPTVRVIDSTQGGVNFRSYINFDKYGNAFIGNVHPIK